jgi:hypothetical protein
MVVLLSQNNHFIVDFKRGQEVNIILLSLSSILVAQKSKKTDDYAKLSFNSLPGLNLAVRFAPTSIASPVFGLRP